MSCLATVSSPAEGTLLHCPVFPDNLAIDASHSNSITAVGKSTWSITLGSCDLPGFDEDVRIQVATNRPVVVAIVSSKQVARSSPRFWDNENDHTTLLIFAWTYILTARWAELIPGASAPEYSEHEAEWEEQGNSPNQWSSDSVMPTVDLGNVDDDAAQWWAAILAPDSGWSATIRGDTGSILHAPWQVKVLSEQPFILSRGTKTLPRASHHKVSSCSTALRYLSDYCKLHDVMEQSHAALAAAMLLPLASFENRRVNLPMPRFRKIPQLGERSMSEASPGHFDWIDRLLPLSCHCVGIKALLNSLFYEPGVECNICGAWLQGTFTFLDSATVQDQGTLLQILNKRDPGLGFLWLGAFMTGAHTRALQEARGGCWKMDPHAASWTGTLMSFIQEPVPILAPEAKEISRADECRLLYYAHDQCYSFPPLFPFAPFGATALADTNLEVRQHARCEANHTLEYKGLAWRCRDGARTSTSSSVKSLRTKAGHSLIDKVSVNYDKFDFEDDECSEMVTRNMFTWLRDEDGFPVAERPIREHEWIDNLEFDDDEPIAGDVRSAAGGVLHGWLMRSLTTRSRSL